MPRSPRGRARPRGVCLAGLTKEEVPISLRKNQAAEAEEVSRTLNEADAKERKLR